MNEKNLIEDYYVILAGGVGASKFIDGLVKIVRPELLKIIINTGDDIDLFGLKICPDLDIITYTLANLIDQKKGWGFIDESFQCMNILKKYYNTDWFNLGDKDLATHIYRTDLFRQGFSKAEITEKICQVLGINSHLIPMSNEPVETYIKTPLGLIHFEEYYIKHHCEPEILNIEFRGITEAKPVKNTIKFIKDAKKVIICPSNPIVSIGTIIQIKGIKEALMEVKKKVYAISPIIQGATIKGPADKLMQFMGFDVSCLSVAKYYQDFLGHFIIDNKDKHLKKKIEELGIKTYCFDTLMNNIKKKMNLANYLINLPGY